MKCVYHGKLKRMNCHQIFEIAKRRFDQLIKKFRHNVCLYDDYNAVIQDYKKQGIVEPVKNDASDSVVYYMPH